MSRSISVVYGYNDGIIKDIAHTEDVLLSRMAPGSPDYMDVIELPRGMKASSLIGTHIGLYQN